MSNTDPHPGVSIIIPNFNGVDLLRSNLPAVIDSMRCYSGATELIVVDDASSDGSADYVRTTAREAKLVQHESNLGFSEAIYSGIKICSFQYAVLLNSDVVPEKDFLSPLMSWFQDDKVFCVSPLIFDDDNEILKYSKNLKRFSRGKFKSLHWSLDSDLERAIQGEKVFHLYSSGGSVAVCRSKFMQLMGFNPIFKPFYFEDMELGIRAWRSGWETLFDPRSRVCHCAGSTIRRFNDRRGIKRIARRNEILVLWLHLSASSLIFAHMPWQFMRTVFDLLRLDSIKSVAVYQAIVSVPEVLKQRRQFRKDELVALDTILSRAQ